MAKTHGQRLKILYILDFLKRESDEEHPVTAKDICEFLDSQGISAERKSVYADISALIDYGADIVRSASPRGWFLTSLEFEEPEIYLLGDAVRNAGFISAAKTREVVKKLDSIVSRFQAQKKAVQEMKHIMEGLEKKNPDASVVKAIAKMKKIADDILS